MLMGSKSRTFEADTALRRRAEETGEGLRTSIETLLVELGKRGMRDQRAIHGALKLSQSAISRIISSVRSGDSLATLSSIPGPEALRQMVKGASSSGVDRDCVQKVEDAVADLEKFLDSEIGDRSTLEAVLSDWVHESRATFELRHKAAAFKAMSALRGVRADMVLSGVIIHPSATFTDLYDTVAIDALLGCRRIRPSGVLRLFGSHPVRADPRFTVTNLAGAPITAMPDMLLPQFSTVPLDSIRTTHHGQFFETTVNELPLGKGLEPGEDLICAQMYHGCRVRRGDGPPTSGIGGWAEPPAEYFVVDALLHEDVWPDAKPELRVFDTVVRGMTQPDDQARQGDRLDLLESVQSLGTGPEAFRLPEFARYPELIRSLCATLGWDASKLRGYRCKVRYPIYGSQINLAFPLRD
jgi:hypothetical protein